MKLRDAIADFKETTGSDTRFPGERRTTTGRFSGSDDRLVHVALDGSLRDFGYPLSGLTGIERSRFGIRRDGEIHWLSAERSTQRYDGDGIVVVTTHETPLGDLTRRDLTVGAAHLTRVDADFDDAAVEFVAALSLSPDGRETRTGQLHHEDAVEIYHDRERDFVASATGFSTFRGQVPVVFDDLTADEPAPYPRPPSDGRYEEDRLSGDLVCSAPFVDGSATLVSLLTDRTETPRPNALGRLDELASRFDAVAAFDIAAPPFVPSVPAATPQADAVAADLRVLSLLSAPTGLRIAGPDFDPFYAHSGGYGYTWFRDDAEISRFLLESDAQFDLGLDEWHERSARAYCATQRGDGSWPHRVWPRDGALAPGWANARLEAGADTDYQADQTGSVIAFLASYRAAGIDDADLEATVEEALELALESLDETLEADGRPVPCQNAWEDATGRFAHTAATFLEAYSALAATDLPIADRAREQADRVYAAVDDLWVPDRDLYAMRERPEAELDAGGDRLDDRADSAALALVGAHRAYDRVAAVDDERLDRLVAHAESVLDALWHDPDESDVAGLIRYEGDAWRQRDQGHEKLWTVSTGWGANAAVQLSALLSTRDDERVAPIAARGRDLLGLVSPTGPLCAETTYLPEQWFDDGTPDSATPLGWPHALRLATVALLDERNLAATESAAASD
ncbi:glycoside hydrolase family 15 protein [Haloferacaceae archaeon DSL9]